MNLKCIMGRSGRIERGMVLITTLLLLIVITILALTMFRGAGLENVIAGNTLDKQRALQAADSAQEYAEQWLLTSAVAQPQQPLQTTDCQSNPALTTVTTAPVICNATLSMQVNGGQVGDVPWYIGGTQVGFPYNPGAALTTSTSGGQNTVYGLPTAYIAELGPDLTQAATTDYVVDAWSYGGSPNTIAVVESTYRIHSLVTQPPL